MKIIKATKEYSKDVSELMLSDLRNPDERFPKEMIDNFREHAKEENVAKEFENPDLIAFLSIEEGKVDGFVVGYKENAYNAMIHYISGNNSVKKMLLDNFIKEAKTRKIVKIITDTFEFMDNNDFFKSNGFKLTKKEKLSKNLEMLWYEIKI